MREVRIRQVDHGYILECAGAYDEDGSIGIYEKLEVVLNRAFHYLDLTSFYKQLIIVKNDESPHEPTQGAEDSDQPA